MCPNSRSLRCLLCCPAARAVRAENLCAVAVLVREHARQFILPLEQRQQPTGHVNAAARNRERVGLLLVDNLKTELPTRVISRGEESLSNFTKVSLRDWQGAETNLPLNQFGYFRSLLDVALWGRTEQLSVRASRQHPTRKSCVNN